MNAPAKNQTVRQLAVEYYNKTNSLFQFISEEKNNAQKNTKVYEQMKKDYQRVALLAVLYSNILKAREKK